MVASNNLITRYKSLEEVHLEVKKLEHEYYSLLYKERKLLHELKSGFKHHQNIDYKQYASKARRLARKQFNKKRGYEINHIKPCLLCFLEDMPVEKCSHISNLEQIKKKENKDKSFLYYSLYSEAI